jgi:hypothetical protein
MSNALPDDIASFLSCRNRSNWTDPRVWQNLVKANKLHISNNTNDNPVANYPSPLDSASTQTKVTDNSLRNNIMQDGYTLLPGNSSDNPLIASLADGITELHKSHSLPATFILLFDEAWYLASSTIAHAISQSNHPVNQFNFDMLAWYIDPSEGTSGFSPHRDRQPPNHLVKDSFHSDGQAKYVTLWMALSHATPENSCLYVIPKDCDPGYLNGDDLEQDLGRDDNNGNDDDIDNHIDDHIENNVQQQDPLSRCLSSKESYQNIRALPRKPGESIAFTHRILHWGSKGHKNCTNSPRIAISFVSSDPSFEKPYLKNYGKYWSQEIIQKQTSLNAIVLPPFEIRLLLVCAQLLIYYQRFDLPKDAIRGCYEYCKERKDELDDGYWKKVSLEFVKAMREMSGSSDKVRDIEQSDIEETKEKDVKLNSNKKQEDDEDDAMLEAMLENADEADDDFDDMVNGDDELSESITEDGNDEYDFESSDGDEECNLFGSIETPQPKKRKF